MPEFLVTGRSEPRALPEILQKPDILIGKAEFLSGKIPENALPVTETELQAIGVQRLEFVALFPVGYG